MKRRMLRAYARFDRAVWHSSAGNVVAWIAAVSAVAILAIDIGVHVVRSRGG